MAHFPSQHPKVRRGGPCPWSGAVWTQVSALSLAVFWVPWAHAVEGAALPGEEPGSRQSPRQATGNDGFQALAPARRAEGNRSCCQGKAVPGPRGSPGVAWPPPQAVGTVGPKGPVSALGARLCVFSPQDTSAVRKERFDTWDRNDPALLS